LALKVAAHSQNEETDEKSEFQFGLYHQPISAELRLCFYKTTKMTCKASRANLAKTITTSCVQLLKVVKMKIPFLPSHWLLLKLPMTKSGL
jgi:hypothetical protein